MFCVSRPLQSFFFSTDLVNTTPFALQNDHLQQFSCVTLGVLTWIPRQNLRDDKSVGLRLPVDPKQRNAFRELFYLLAHAEDDLQVLGVGQQSVRVDGDVVVEKRHHI